MTDEQIIMSIIANSGDSISSTMEAIAKANQKDRRSYETAMDRSLVQLQEAHRLHTDLLVREARGEDVHISMLLIHAATHMANAELARTFAEVFASMLIPET